MIAQRCAINHELFFFLSLFKVKMNNRNTRSLLVILNTLLFVVPGGCYIIPTLPDNCTCVTREGLTYSLYPLRRTDGKPR